MTYVREQTSAELAAHIRSLQKMDGWFDPLSDRLWQEVEALQAELAGLMTGYEAYERVNAELKADNEALRGAGAGALRFVAFAFDEGVEGAELAGRAIEDAIGAKS
ncbi:hypothetical protein JJD61_07240 [Pseudomonas carnis]|uniref:hypothetical protein n=1 Tax=Pseudomonas carnis TaxID=2487355 RepID=UPI00190E01A9|nr:hypothetical protein [Pseudomonas carnis]MBK3470476.1 hypothetical protein [Pseudomonas carnis]